jgi:hypothetical protein
MGYYTAYSLNFDKKINGDFVDNDTVIKIGDYIEDGLDGYALDRDGDYTDSVKWYEHDDFMTRMSREFPDVIFDLYGEGEEAGDMWHKYYVNGRRQIAKGVITFDEFDPLKLV